MKEPQTCNTCKKPRKGSKGRWTLTVPPQIEIDLGISEITALCPACQPAPETRTPKG